MRLTAAALLAALAVSAFGCGGDDGGETSGATTAAPAVARGAGAADIVGFEFVPAKTTIAAGGSVTWRNSDAAPHTATADDREAFDTGTLRTGQSKRIVFDEPGSYRYYCLFHPFMKGTVLVVE
jgi:plastocyanin